MVRPIPEGAQAVTPYLSCKGAAQALDFYARAFGARERMRMGDETTIGHAEITIGNAVIYLADEHPNIDFLSPQTIGGTPVIVHVYVEDVDAIARDAEAAGAKILRPVADQFYGDRTVVLQDPFGHRWSFATHVEDVTEEEMQRRAESRQ
jgi:PhnB protein